MQAYAVKVGRVKVAPKRPDGSSWDVLGLPDLYVVIKNRGPDRHTATASSCVEHEFDESIVGLIEPGDQVFVRVMDHDLNGNDELIGRTSVKVTEADLQRGYLELTAFGSVEYLKLAFDFALPQMKRRPH
ncbi:MAG: C2 domain-containing protein [Planctomycetota bacterium]